MEQEYNPEQSPYFSHWQYKSKFHERYHLGERKPLFHQDIPLAKLEEWSEKAGTGAIVAFADNNPELTVTTEVDGEAKTITLPAWARDNNDSGDLQSYYKKSPWVYRCVNIKAETFSSIPWQIYPENPATADDADAVEPLEDDSEPVTLLRDVNPEDNWGDFSAKISNDMNIFGVAYVRKIRRGENGEGEVILLERLNPNTVEVLADESGIRGFRQSLGSEHEIHEREDIMYFRGYDPNNDVGSVSPLQACKTNVEIEIQANSHLADFFANNAMPTLIMSTPNELQFADLQKMQGAWKKEFRGKGKRGQTAFMSHGFTPNQLSYPLNQLALEEIREESRRSICTSFGVPMSMVGATEAVNFATMKEQRESLYTETIMPFASYIQGVINAELMDEFEDMPYFRFEAETLAVLQDDIKERAEWLKIAVDALAIKPSVMAIELGFTEDDVPEPVPVPDFQPQTEPESDSKAVKHTQGVQRAETAQAELMIDLNKWRRKAINKVRKSQSPFCPFESDFIPEVLTSVIESGLMNAETVDDVHDVFNGANTKKSQQPIINVNTPDIRIEPADIKVDVHTAEKEVIVNSPDVIVNIPEQKAPEVNVKIDAPEVQVVNPRIDVNVPKVVHSSEEQEVQRDINKLIKGSKTTTEYTYDDE
jgi:HK97 family phage portal protein